MSGESVGNDMLPKTQLHEVPVGFLYCSGVYSSQWVACFSQSATFCTATSFIDLLERARTDKLSGYILQDNNCSILRAGIVNQWLSINICQ